MSPIPRVAFFTDTFTETNGVALTSRQLESFARRRDYPFLCVKGADKTDRWRDGSVTSMDLGRGALGFDLDRGLRHDPLLWLHKGDVAAVIRAFRPDVIHVVSPGDVSEIGAFIAKEMNLPLAISWHTNLHEFAAMRLGKMLGWMGSRLVKGVMSFCEWQVLNAVIAFYRLGDVLFAPNDELIGMLRERTGKPVFL